MCFVQVLVSSLDPKLDGLWRGTAGPTTVALSNKLNKLHVTAEKKPLKKGR